jgi:hypothetical protein
LFEVGSPVIPVPNRGNEIRPILESDIPPVPVETVVTGSQDGLRWTLVAAEAKTIRCFGLALKRENFSKKFACNARSLGEKEPLGGIVFAPAEFSKPVLFGEAWEEVTAIQAVWGHGSTARTRVETLSSPLRTGVKLFVVVLPHDIHRLRLVAKDANYNVMASLRVCCPPSGVRHPPLFPLCHGRSRTPDHWLKWRSSHRLRKFTSCPPIDVVWGVEFMSSPMRERL